MSQTHLRSLGRATGAGLAVALLVAFGASGALAATMGLTFNGPTDTAGKHWGVSASSATSSGIPIMIAPLFNADGNLKVTNQELNSLTLDKEDLSTPFEVTSDWTTKAQRNLKASEVFLVFTSIDPRTIKINGKKKEVDYDPTQVGLRLDSNDGWVLMQVNDRTLGTIYYPAFRIGPMKEGKGKGVDVPYFMKQIVQFDRKNGNQTIVPLPKLRIGVALAPIPEPGTALLLAAGLIGLAARGRQHE